MPLLLYYVLINKNVAPYTSLFGPLMVTMDTESGQASEQHGGRGSAWKKKRPVKIHRLVYFSLFRVPCLFTMYIDRMAEFRSVCMHNAMAVAEDHTLYTPAHRRPQGNCVMNV